MKVTEAEKTVEQFGISNQKSFDIKFDAKMASILADGLYSDKIMAVIRELSCNAYDSHIAANNPEPFELHLPTKLEPWFEIKDYGTGLSPEDWEKIYTTYGESTKTTSNAFIGQLGLGSKSPFAYTDAFTGSTRFNGTEYIYSMFKDDDGMPSFAEMGSNKTDEKNGITIKFPVKQEDLYKFELKANEFFKFNEINPKSNIKLEKAELKKQKEKWALINGYNEIDSVVRMGHIVYPLNFSLLPNITAKLPNLIYNFDIGDLEVAASRESLQYSKKTIKILEDKINDANTDFGIFLQKEINATITKYDAIVFLKKIVQNRQFAKYIKVFNLTYKGDDLLTIAFNALDFYDENSVEFKSVKSKFNMDENKNVVIHTFYTEQVIFHDIKRSLTREYQNVLPPPNTGKTWNDLNEALMGIPVVYSSKLNLQPRPTRTKRDTKDYRLYNSIRSSNVIEMTDADFDKGGIYVQFDTSPIISGKKIHMDNFYYLIMDLNETNVLKRERIFFPYKHQLEKFEKNPNWIKLDKIIDDAGDLFYSSIFSRGVSKIIQFNTKNPDLLKLFSYQAKPKVCYGKWDIIIKKSKMDNSTYAKIYTLIKQKYPLLLRLMLSNEREDEYINEYLELMDKKHAGRS